MKKIIGYTLIAGFVTTSVLSGCGEESKKDLKNANENFKEANADMKEAAKDANAEAKAKATADWRTFKHESDSSIAVMEKQVIELKDKIDKSNKKAKAKLNSDLSKLEEKVKEQKAKLNHKNEEFETDMKNFNDTLVSKNESFQREFKHDMTELGTALKDQFKDNVK